MNYTNSFLWSALPPSLSNEEKPIQIFPVFPHLCIIMESQPHPSASAYPPIVLHQKSKIKLNISCYPQNRALKNFWNRIANSSSFALLLNTLGFQWIFRTAIFFCPPSCDNRNKYCAYDYRCRNLCCCITNKRFP